MGTEAPAKRKAELLLMEFQAAQQSRGLLTTTIKRRHHDLKKFEVWLAPRDLQDATEADVVAFLLTRGWASPTRYAFLAHLHAYYTWAVKVGVVLRDPTVNIDRPRLRPGLPRPITDDQLAYLLHQSEGRMRTWLMLAAFGGLRCMEIAGLNRCDVVDQEGYMRVLGKGSKERLVPLHPAVLESLRCLPMPRYGPLYRMGDGRPQTAFMVSQCGNRWIRKMGVEATMHRLRHWFGTRSYQECQDIVAVAELMGHSNTATTSVYVKFNNRVATSAVLGLKVPGVS